MTYFYKLINNTKEKVLDIHPFGPFLSKELATDDAVLRCKYLNDCFETENCFSFKVVVCTPESMF